MEKKLKLTITGMHCASCAMNIDGELEDMGVKQSNTSYAKGETMMIFDDAVIAETAIREKIQSLGYTVAL